MKIQKKNSHDERRLLIALITDTTALSMLAGEWEMLDNPFASRYANLIGDWCVKHYRKYQQAPGRHIQDIFYRWHMGRSRDEATVNAIDTLLMSLSDEYDQTQHNSQFAVDQLNHHFNMVRLSRLVEDVQEQLETGGTAAALDTVAKWRQVEMGLGSGIDPLTDDAAIKAVFSETSDTLIRYPGALGEFFADRLQRDAFVSFLAPEKRGKTWWLWDVAYRALRARCKVAFFEVGDMSQNQIMRRFMIRFANQPWKASRVLYPVSLERGDAGVTVTHEERVFDRDLDYPTAKQACQGFLTTRLRASDDHSYFKLSVHPNSSLSVNGLRGVLTTWEQQSGWTPDVVVIDYADILAPLNPRADFRHQVNETWQHLRALSQERHCLLVTATQAAARSYGAELLSRNHFSEDKRKLAHVTLMVGINTTPSERSEQRSRLNCVVEREELWGESRCVHTAGCFAVGNPAVKSCW
jgi:replicative DNA helicase